MGLGMAHGRHAPALVEDAQRDAPCRGEAVGVGDRDPDRVRILLARRDIARNNK